MDTEHGVAPFFGVKVEWHVVDKVEQCFAGSVADDFNRLAKECPYLNAVIQETLRLWPPGELMKD